MVAADTDFFEEGEGMTGEMIKTIGIMTSGGDSPGMNPCIRAVVRNAVANNIRVMGIYDGYEGLIHGNFRELGTRDVSGILQRGGTILRTARSEEFRSEKGQREAIRSMNNAKIDGLVIIGGDGSLTGAHKLAEQGVPVIGAPASIDNDIFGTDMCIGVDTALNTIVNAVDKIRDTASSHSRAFLVETMGRHCGYLALMAAVNAGAEMVLIPEIETPIEEISKVVDSAYRRGKRHCIIMVAEGFKPSTTELAKTLDEMDLGFITRVTILGHLQRGGTSSAFDRWLASRFGYKTVEFLLEGHTDVMVGLNGREIEPVPLEQIINNQRTIPVATYNIARVLAA